MRRFELLVGMHVQPDRSRPLLDHQGRPTGRYESRAFVASGGKFPLVESDTDLVALFGPEKFRACDEAAGGGPDARQLARENQSLAEENERLRDELAAMRLAAADRPAAHGPAQPARQRPPRRPQPAAALDAAEVPPPATPSGEDE